MILGTLVEHDGQLWIDTGHTNICGRNRFRVVARQQRFLAVKIPGGKYFGGQSRPQNYSPATFRVMICEDLDSYAPGSQWAERLEISIRS